jgi:transposase-like protein
MKPKILSDTNEEMDEVSTYCPRCGSTNIEMSKLSGVDFDDCGWYHKRAFMCKSAKCGHMWGNRIIVLDARQQ